MYIEVTWQSNFGTNHAHLYFPEGQKEGGEHTWSDGIGGIGGFAVSDQMKTAMKRLAGLSNEPSEAREQVETILQLKQRQLGSVNADVGRRTEQQTHGRWRNDFQFESVSEVPCRSFGSDWWDDEMANGEDWDCSYDSYECAAWARSQWKLGTGSFQKERVYRSLQKQRKVGV